MNTNHPVHNDDSSVAPSSEGRPANAEAEHNPTVHERQLATIATLRKQNAALVDALERIANLRPDNFASPAAYQREVRGIAMDATFKIRHQAKQS
jgi:hypothetical protein